MRALNRGGSFVDVFSRMIVGWALATDLRTELPLPLLHRRHRTPAQAHRMEVLQQPLEPGQYTAIRYGEKLGGAGILPSIGSEGDSFDNALAESTIGLFKTELVELHGPRSTCTETELAVLEYVNWFSTARLHGERCHVPPREYEEAYYRQQHSNLVEGQIPHMTLSTEPTAVHPRARHEEVERR